MKRVSIFLVMLAWMLTPTFSQTVQTTVDQKLQDNTTTVDSVDRWQSGGFIRYEAPHTFSFSVPDTEVLRGTLKIILSDLSAVLTMEPAV